MIARAARHLDHAQRLQDEADEVLWEAQAFSVSGELNEDGTVPGDVENTARLLEIHTRLVERAAKHTAKARALLSRVRHD